MANASQVKALVKSHADGDDRRFYSVALQVAARADRSSRASSRKSCGTWLTSCAKTPNGATGAKPSLANAAEKMTSVRSDAC
jgi:hypothetical protein